jgi:hypothetical protein
MQKQVDYRRLYATAATWLGLDLAGDSYLSPHASFDLFDP